MRAKRSKLEICFNILESISSERLNITRTMYRVGLNYYQARRFLDYLLQHNLINKVEEERGTTYGITEKGRILLEHYKPIKEELGLP